MKWNGIKEVEPEYIRAENIKNDKNGLDNEKKNTKTASPQTP